MAKNKEVKIEAPAETIEQKTQRVSQQINAILEHEGLKLNIGQVINIIPK